MFLYDCPRLPSAIAAELSEDVDDAGKAPTPEYKKTHGDDFAGAVAISRSPIQHIACSRLSPHMPAFGWSEPHTCGRSG
jgi:hypothetical protein